MNHRGRLDVYVFSLILFINIISLCRGASDSPVPSDYGQAVIDSVLRVNSQCWIYCDIRDWPAIIGKEMPVQIRGIDSQSAQGEFELSVRQFILETLNAALHQKPSPADPNKQVEPPVLLKHIQRAKDFCLLADVQVNGQDLAQMLVDKGYAKKIIIPKTVPGTLTNSANTGHSNQPSPLADSFIASKSGKVFHKSTCPHAKRIADNTKVIYQTRDEAIAAGRRPCQTCNP